MQKYFDINEAGFSIRCKIYFQKDIKSVKNVVIATYGFGGNKDNKAIEKFADRLTSKYKGFGVICFDWPNHGKDARNKLILAECLQYMDLVLGYVRANYPDSNIYNYSSSLGAYLTLKYFTERGENPFFKTAFRCPALRLFKIMDSNITEDERTKLNKGKDIERGYDRKIMLGQDFFDELESFDPTEHEYFDYAEDILILHGTKDDMAPFEDTQKFADDNVIELIPVENADHAFSNPSYMDLAIQKIIEFFGN